jgi:hypothetical protein
MAETKLDFDSLDDSYFISIADILLNGCYLTVNKNKYRLIEIEFYLKCNSHYDPYTHGDPDQLLQHTFYFHKFKTGTYKSGTFKGLDLTFGDSENNAYFGILIRSIQSIKTGNITEGPCNVVNKILDDYKLKNITDLTKGKNLNIFQNKMDFILVPSDNLSKKNIFYGPRIGLSNKHPEYQNKNYRFVADKCNIKKKKTTLVEI